MIGVSMMQENKGYPLTVKDYCEGTYRRYAMENRRYIKLNLHRNPCFEENVEIIFKGDEPFEVLKTELHSFRRKEGLFLNKKIAASIQMRSLLTQECIEKTFDGTRHNTELSLELQVDIKHPETCFKADDDYCVPYLLDSEAVFIRAQYFYHRDHHYSFMDEETYSEIIVDEKDIGNAMNNIEEMDTVMLKFVGGKFKAILNITPIE